MIVYRRLRTKWFALRLQGGHSELTITYENLWMRNSSDQEQSWGLPHDCSNGSNMFQPSKMLQDIAGLLPMIQFWDCFTKVWMTRHTWSESRISLPLLSHNEARAFSRPLFVWSTSWKDTFGYIDIHPASRSFLWLLVSMVVFLDHV